MAPIAVRVVPARPHSIIADAQSVAPHGPCQLALDARIAACTDEVWPVPIVIDRPMTGCHDTVVTHGDTESDGAAFATGCEGRDRRKALRRPVPTPRILGSEMERNVAAVIELMDVDERPAIDRRLGDRRLGERRVPTADVASWMPPRRERRTAHLFQAADGSHDGHIVARVSCLICGYGEAGHLTLTEPEQEVVTGLLNQRQAPALMRRSILRKLSFRLHIR